MVEIVEAAPPDASTEPLARAEPLPDMPLPTDLRTVVQVGLFLLALLAAIYVAAAIVLPMVLAFVLKLLLQPAMRVLQRGGLPRGIAAVLVLLAFFGIVGAFGALLYVPAQEWVAKLPQIIPQFGHRLRLLREPIDGIGSFLQSFEHLASIEPAPVADTAPAPEMAPVSLSTAIFSSTRAFLTGLFATALLLLFLLISGDTFLRRLVEILPSFKDKRQAVDISQQIERDISGYLMTITVMNAGVGCATGLVMWLCGVGTPLLWGAAAFLLNYVPIAGPMVGIGLFLLVGLSSSDPLWLALLPAGCYLAIHLIEGEAVTPMLVAKRFTLNPVLVILTLMFWFWMWGVPGAILGVPMLAITKIVCDRVRPLAALGHFVGG